MQIIGCGNRERGDDAAGILVVEELRRSCTGLNGVTLKTCSGEATELIDSWSTNDDVIVVDAVVTGGTPGTVHRWAGDVPGRAGGPSPSSHGFGIHEAIRLARALGRLPKFITVYGIEGQQFEIGGAISPEVEHGVHRVTQQIRTEILRRDRAARHCR